jgi:hypothetical protein
MAPNQAEVVILISKKSVFKSKVRRDNDSQVIWIKETVHQVDVMIVCTCTSHVTAPNFIKHTLQDIKAQIHNNRE